MKQKSIVVSVAFLVSLFAPSLLGQAPRPRPPAPKPVEDVPPPNIGPAVDLPTPATSQPTRWAMFDGNPWPSDEQPLALLAQACGSIPYQLGPDARQTIILETAVRNLRTVLAQWHQARRILVIPVGSADINAWTVNVENVLWIKRQVPNKGEEELGSLICVPRGIVEFFLDAPEELEAIIAHEMGHAVDIPCYFDVRPRTLFPNIVQQSCESRADAFALNAFIAQGKNPFAVAGAFGRLQMYLGDTSTGLFARLKNAISGDHPITPDRIRDLRRMLLESFRTHQLQPLPSIIR